MVETDRGRDPDCDADEFRYERGLYDFRGEINAVRGEENHHQCYNRKKT